MKENKKIKNATSTEFNHIKFKSKTEVMVYKTLTEQGFEVYYEPTKYVIWKGFKPTVPFYNKDRKTKLLKVDQTKLIDITYTPDFVFLAPDQKTVVIVEVKGFENDVFPIKKKLFRAYLEDLVKSYNQPTVFFEVYSKKQLLQAINIINTEYGQDTRTDLGENKISSR